MFISQGETLRANFSYIREVNPVLIRKLFQFINKKLMKKQKLTKTNVTKRTIYQY